MSAVRTVNTRDDVANTANQADQSQFYYIRNNTGLREKITEDYFTDQ